MSQALPVPRAGGPRSRRPRRRHGFVLVGVLIVLALAALAAVQTGQRLADARQRANEAELLFVGEQYRAAIQSYWRQSPGAVRSWPARLEDLVEDHRFPVPRRHLRKLYADPLAPATPWGLVNHGGALIGVYSRAEGTPFRQAGFNSVQLGFDAAQQYADWRFVASLPLPSGAARGPGGPKTPTPAILGGGGAPTPALPRGVR